MRNLVKHQRTVLYALGKGAKINVTHDKDRKGGHIYRLSDGREVSRAMVDNLRDGGLIRTFDAALFPGEEPQSYELTRGE